MDEKTRERLVQAVEGHTQAVSSGRVGDLYEPYPQYNLVINTASIEGGIAWHDQLSFSVVWRPKSSFEPDWVWVFYVQEDRALWKALEEIAPAPHYGPENIRHLLHTSELTSRWEGREYTYDLGLILRIARGLTYGTPTDTAPQSQEAYVTLLFIVDGTAHEVLVWEHEFTYGGRTYQRENAYISLRSVLDWGTEKR